jgi:ABC-type glycerol-3-phosphate transport system substrate-binding protein
MVQKAPINIATIDGNQSQGLLAQQQALKAATGIDMTVAALPGDQHRPKITADFISGAGVYDVIVEPWVWVHEWQEGGYLLPLDDYIAADPTINVADFIQALYKTEGNFSGKQYTFPWDPDTELFLYRKDLFEDPKMQTLFKSRTGKDLAVPQTVDDYATVAAFFTKSLNPDSPVNYGYSGWGETYGCFWWWAMRLADLGGSYLDSKMHPNINNDAGLKALNDYIGMLKYTSPDFLTYEWTKSNASYLSGQVAMFENYSPIAVEANTPQGSWGASAVVGKNGYGIPPGYMVNGQLVQGSVLGGYVIAISKFTKQPELAYKTVAWLTSPSGEPLKEAAGDPPGRKSTYANVQTSLLTEYYPAFLNCLDNGLIGGDVDAGAIGESMETVMQDNIHQALAGQLTPAQALKAIEDDWTKELKGAGLYQ